MQHDHYMQQALALADRAESLGEVPVGAVVVLNNQIIGEGWNQPIQNHDPSAHAEIMALRSAAQNIGNYRLVHAELYVTLEPCIMCMGAMFHARIAHCYFGAYDPKTGAAESALNLGEHALNFHMAITGGVMADNCSHKLSQFFRNKRLAAKQAPTPSAD